MNIHPYIENAIHVAKEACKSGKETAIWFGHKVSCIMNDHILPTLRNIGTVALANFRTFQQYAAKNLGQAFVISGAFFVAGLGAFEIANNNKPGIARTAWKTVGLAAFICGVATAGACLAAIPA